MFTTLRKLFGRKAEPAIATPGGFSQAPPPSRLTKPVSSPRALPATPARVELPPRNGSNGSPTGPIPQNMAIPLKSVLTRLPADLMQRIRQIDVGEAELFVPMQKILSQITQGTVKISFGELRQASPPGTFTAENDRDRTLVELPLHEILSRLNPTLLARRPAQKHVVIPPEVPGPFGGQTKVVISTNTLKPVAEAAKPAPLVQPPAVHTPAAPTQVASSQTPFRAQPFAGTPVQPPARPQPAAPATQPIPSVAARVRPAMPAQPAPPVSPVTQAAPVRPPAPAAPVTQPAPVRPPAPAAPVAQAAPVKPPVAVRTVSPLASQQTAEEFGFNFKRAESAPAPGKPAEVVRPAAAAPASELVAVPTPAPVRDLAPAAPPAAIPVAPAAPVTSIAPTSLADESPIPCSIPLQQPVATAAPVAVAAPVAPVAPPAPAAPAETRFLKVLLAALAESWPEPLRQEINAQHLSALSVALPMGVIEGAIKQGKVAFPWKAVRSWIKPPVAESVSPHDSTLVDLPLKVITPLFLTELKANRAQKKVSFEENIPDLFSDARQSDSGAAPAPAPVRPPAPAPVAPVPVAARAYVPPAPAPVAPAHAPSAPVATPIPQEAPVFAFSAPGTPATIAPAAPATPAVQAQPAKTSDTNYYSLQNGEEIPGETPLVFKKPGTPSTAFLNRYATPNEIVNKAASLQGVDGALIALPDGLLVASRIPSTMNADTIAAFLPQIFAKVSQCTRELRLGELNNLNFTVGNIPWKIFRVGSIYFAAFGRPGEAMPTGQLAGIAAELDRKAK